MTGVTDSSNLQRRIGLASAGVVGLVVFVAVILLDPDYAQAGLLAVLKGNPAVWVAAVVPPLLVALAWTGLGGADPAVVRAPTPVAAPTRRASHDPEVEKLRAQLDQARKNSEAKSQFLASMSHELRTPLNAIIGYSEMMQEDVEDDVMPDGDDLDRVTTSARHLLELINNILDLSKIEVGKMSVLLEPVSVGTLFHEVQNTVRPLAAQRNNALVVRIDKSIRQVRGDHMRLRQIMINLLSNAFKFTQDGTVTLSARLEPGSKGLDWAHLTVADEGIGMTAEQVELLFQDYTQASSEIKRRFGGTGLGLAICHKFAEMMFGKIRVESEPGKGSSFTLVLPVPEHFGDPPSYEGELERPQVLVVDADPVAPRIQSHLQKNGFDVSVVKDVEAARGALEASAHNLLLVDVSDDNKPAWALVRERAAMDRPRVVVISINDEDQLRASELGARGFVPKPVDLDLLVSTASRTMRP